jgi:AcrR family transcriptional regulator
VTQRERILEAAYRLVAEQGMARTTIEDVAKDAGVSRPTIYRHFPGGKDGLFAEVVAWEAARFIDELTHAIAARTELAAILEELIVVGAERIEAHQVLQKVLQTEPERLLPLLVLQSDRLIAAVRSFVESAGVRDDEAADYIARMVLSFLGAPGAWDLTDREEVGRLVRTQLLAGVAGTTGVAGAGE